MAAPDRALLTRYIQLHALKAGVDPALAVAVATQESWLNPNAVGDGGKSLGLFQLQRAAAIDAGIDPARRGEIALNVQGGVAYLKQKLQQSRGNVEQALSRYNRGTPDYRGIGDPRYVENVLEKMERGPAPQPGLLRRASRMLSPASAEAAAPQTQRSEEAMPSREALEARKRELLEARKALLLQERERLAGAPAAADTFPPLADQEAASTQKALTGQLPQDYSPSTGFAAPAPAPAPEASDPKAGYEVEVIPGGTPAAPQPPSMGQRLGQAAETALKGVPIAGQLYPLVKPVLQAQYGEHLEQLPRMGAAGAISTTGAMLGTAAGTLAAPFTGPLAPAMPLVGEMAGSYLGRQLNVGLGLEDPGWQGDVASVAVPPVVRGAARVIGPVVTRAAKAVTRRLPGAATAMHEDIAARLHAAEGNIRPAQPVADYYAEARRYNPPIAPSSLHATANAIIRTEMRLQPAARNAELLRLAEGMRDLAQQGPVPLRLFDEHRQRLGETVRAWRNRGDTGERQVRRLYGAFHDDMERAAQQGIPGAQELRTAIGASRAEHTAEDFLDLFRPGSGGVTVDPQGRIQFHGGKLRTRWNNRLRDDPVFAGGITPQVHAEVDDIITQAQRLERLRPPRGAQYGSGRTLARAVIGSMAGGPVGTALAVAGPDVIAAAMQTQRGRAAVRWALQEGGGRINADALAMIGALVRPAVQEAVTEPVSETGGGPVGP